MEKNINNTHICYAIYENIEESPLQRYDNIEVAKSDMKYGMYLVTEVTSYRNGALFIEYLRVIAAPLEWINVRHIPEYDEEYLCHIVCKEECGVFNKIQRVVSNTYGEWIKESNWRITHWMIVPSPK